MTDIQLSFFFKNETILQKYAIHWIEYKTNISLVTAVPV